MLALDFDPTVVGIASRPLWLSWRDEAGKLISHAPAGAVTASMSSSATCITSTPKRNPSCPTIAKDPAFREKFGPRGVLHTWANADGTQRIEDTGPLTKKRMETCDEEFRDAAVDFIKRQHEADTPFFVWFNATHMHFRTHPKPESIGRAGRWQSEYHDTMLDHDDLVGSLLDLLDELGIADNTIVMYSTDNGPHMNTWPDAGMTPFRNEKNSNWEGAYRVPAMVRWPGAHPGRHGVQRNRQP